MCILHGRKRSLYFLPPNGIFFGTNPGIDEETELSVVVVGKHSLCFC